MWIEVIFSFGSFGWGVSRLFCTSQSFFPSNFFLPFSISLWPWLAVHNTPLPNQPTNSRFLDWREIWHQQIETTPNFLLSAFTWNSPSQDLLARPRKTRTVQASPVSPVLPDKLNNNCSAFSPPHSSLLLYSIPCFLSPSLHSPPPSLDLSLQARTQGGFGGFERTLPLGFKGPLNQTKKNQHTFRERTVVQPLCFYRQNA